PPGWLAKAGERLKNIMAIVDNHRLTIGCLFIRSFLPVLQKNYMAPSFFDQLVKTDANLITGPFGPLTSFPS
ncbi:MAG: hypothetical protein R3231_06820, partial [bacterium]|nr:hypothetical protein [bacterium]